MALRERDGGSEYYTPGPIDPKASIHMRNDNRRHRSEQEYGLLFLQNVLGAAGENSVPSLSHSLSISEADHTRRGLIQMMNRAYRSCDHIKAGGQGCYPALVPRMVRMDPLDLHSFYHTL